MTAGGVTTTYLVDTANPTGYPQVLEELVGGAVQRVYTYGTARISQSQTLNGAWITSFYGYDGQGSVRFLTDATGAVTDRYTYDAFGSQLAASGTTPNVYRYVGEPYDQALQMTYLRARYMYPASGRFWTMDTFEGNLFDPPSLHKYLYVAGDPANRTDPSGQVALPFAIAAGILGGAFVWGLIYWSVLQGRVMRAGGEALRTARVMIQAALSNLQSGQPAMKMPLFLSTFMGKDAYFKRVAPDRAGLQLAYVTTKFQRLAEGAQHAVAFVANPVPQGDIIAESLPPWYVISPTPLFLQQEPKEQARTVVHELCHIVLRFKDIFYGDVSLLMDLIDDAANPDTYSFYAMHSWEGQGP
jgi:RHS repeat-associated protein